MKKKNNFKCIFYEIKYGRNINIRNNITNSAKLSPTIRAVLMQLALNSTKVWSSALEDVILMFHKLLLYLVFFCVAVENNLEIHSQVCAASVHLG